MLASAIAFRTGLYRGVLDPASTAGTFENSIARVTALPAQSDRDVLVLGDSRIYSGLDPSVASAASGGLRFLNAGVPGTTPRCWFFYARAIDPQTHRFRAIVVPVDTYADDDGAIGSVDGDDRAMDLHYIVFRTGIADIPKLAASFSDPHAHVPVALDVLLRGPELRDDVQAFAADPAARFRALLRARTDDALDPLTAHPRTETLAGLRVDFAAGTIGYPPAVDAVERHEMELQVLKVARPSPSYALYRRRWLEPIVARYAAAGVPVVFVRIPTRPVHRDGAPQRPQGVLRDLVQAYGARALPAAPYLALETPQTFADHDHLNRAGSRAFSALLGRDVAGALAQPAPPVRAAPFPAPAGSGFRPLHVLAAVLAIGVPLQFQSYEFWIFFALVAIAFYAAPRAARRFVLLAASYYFYARWNAWYVVFLLALTVSDYGLALALERMPAGSARRAVLTAGVAANVAFLGTFKYLNFATSTVTALIGMHANPWLVELIVPIGISFHTFQSISYLVDVYRGRMRAVRDPFDYALYLAFFPQLLAGPIVRAGLFFGELFAWRRPGAHDVGYGFARIVFGLVKKVAIADQFAPVSDAYFAAPAAHPGALAAWGALFAFAMQIYFDFSGYSDIAIGCARLLGFVFPENFRMPYLAISITDFWHRWHVTLSTWLRDYVYIPLGGSRDGRAATLRNLMLTMLIGGLWHGAQWTFVAWGGVHGALLCAERLAGIGRSGDRPHGLVYAARAALTFVVVSLAWVLFRAPTFATAAAAYDALVRGGTGAPNLIGWPAVLAAGLVAFACVRLAAGAAHRTPSWIALPAFARAGLLAAGLAALELFSWPGAPATFIYFKF